MEEVKIESYVERAVSKFKALLSNRIVDDNHPMIWFRKAAVHVIKQSFIIQRSSVDFNKYDTRDDKELQVKLNDGTAMVCYLPVLFSAIREKLRVPENEILDSLCLP